MDLPEKLFEVHLAVSLSVFHGAGLE